MSVFDHDYRPYEGRLTPLGSRPLVLARYALHEAWSSKISIGLFVLSLLPCLVELVIIYVADNPIARALILRGQSAESPLAINEHFFLNVLETQCWFALVLAAWIAPRLVSFDLGDNALPILLSHPDFALRISAGQVSRADPVAVVRHVDPLPRTVCLPVLRIAGAVGDGASIAWRSAFSSARRSGSCCFRWWGLRYRRG